MQAISFSFKKAPQIENNLIYRIAKGDQLAFRALYNLYKDKVYNVALSYLRNVELAEEITQDVFITVFQKAFQFQSKSKVSTWIYRITVNKALNEIKRTKAIRSKLLDVDYLEPVDFIHPGVALEQKELSKYLFMAIESLSENQRTAFILSFIEKLPRKEVAQIMETSLKSVESLIQRAKQNLRKEIIRQYPEGNRNN